MAGPSSPCFERFLQERPDGIPSWLSFLGPLPLDQRADLFAAIDLFSMPSRTDSYGIVFLEAWANGLAVVAADAGGVPEVVRHNQTGLLVPFGSVDQLAQSIDRLITDRAEAERLGTAGKNLVQNGFSWNDRYATLLARSQQAIALNQSTRQDSLAQKAG